MASSVTYLSCLIPGGIKRILQIAAASNNPKVQEVVALAKEVPIKGFLRIEDICRECKITPADFISELVRVSVQINASIARIMTATAEPDIVKMAIKRAKTMKGDKERTMLLQHLGYLPMPKGATFNISHTSNTAVLNAKGKQGKEPEQVDAEENMDFTEIIMSNAAAIEERD